MPAGRPPIQMALTEERVIEALRKAGGVMAGAARLLGCTRENITYWAASRPHIRLLCKELREEITDIAELGLISAIRNREEWAIKFWLSRQGRHRGYGHALWVGVAPTPENTQQEQAEVFALSVDQLEQIERWYIEGSVNDAPVADSAAGTSGEEPQALHPAGVAQR